MAIGTGTALLASAAIGAASSMAGKKKGTGTPEASGFAALPKAVQNAWLNTYLPKAMAASQLPYQAMPMQRATNPANDPFASQALWDLQRYSDAKGGLFSPMMGNSNTLQASPGAAMASTMGNQGGGDFTAQQYLSALRGNGQGIPNPLYTALSQQVSNDPTKLATLSKALSQQNYNPNLGSRGVNANAILAALGS